MARCRRVDGLRVGARHLKKNSRFLRTNEHWTRLCGVSRVPPSPSAVWWCSLTLISSSVCYRVEYRRRLAKEKWFLDEKYWRAIRDSVPSRPMKINSSVKQKGKKINKLTRMVRCCTCFAWIGRVEEWGIRKGGNLRAVDCTYWFFSESVRRCSFYTTAISVWRRLIVFFN